MSSSWLYAWHGRAKVNIVQGSNNVTVISVLRGCFSTKLIELIRSLVNYLRHSKIPNQWNQVVPFPCCLAACSATNTGGFSVLSFLGLANFWDIQSALEFLIAVTLGAISLFYFCVFERSFHIFASAFCIAMHASNCPLKSQLSCTRAKLPHWRIKTDLSYIY